MVASGCLVVLERTEDERSDEEKQSEFRLRLYLGGSVAGSSDTAIFTGTDRPAKLF